MMRYYMARFTITDNTHEHTERLVVWGKNLSIQEAEMFAKTQEHDFIDREENLTVFDYGDGQTSAELDCVIKITKREADTLDRLGAAYYLRGK